MKNSRGIGPAVAALLMPTLIFNTIALSGCDSSDDGRLKLANPPSAEHASIGGSSSVSALRSNDAINRQDEHQESPFRPSFTAVDCLEMTSTEVVANILQNDPTITCGRVSVPANWEIPDRNMIEIAVYRVAPTTRFPTSDPVVVLAGGPGQSGIGILLDFVDADVAYLRERSEIIVVDQRGTGFSTPSLVCPAAAAIRQGDETRDTPKTIDTYTAAMENALLACAENLVEQDVNLGDYTTANNARDIDAIRQALDVEQWNLFGVSYGTTLALTIMRDWPSGVRSAVLDSAVPLQTSVLTDQSYAKAYWPMSRIVANCKADTDCHEVIGDIQPSIEAGIARLATSPIGRLNANRYIMDILSRNIGDPDLATVIRVIAFLSDEEIADILDLNLAVADSTTDAPVDAMHDDSVPTPIADTPQGLIPMLMADSMFMAIVCAEEIPYSAITASPDISGDFQKTTREVVEQLAKTVTYSDDFCGQLGVLPADPVESQAVRSDLPVLIFVGDTDSSSPPVWSQRAAETLPNAQYVEFPRAGHVLATEGFDCSAELLMDFLDAPEEAVDRSCVEALPLVDYAIWTQPKADTAPSDRRIMD